MRDRGLRASGRNFPRMKTEHEHGNECDREKRGKAHREGFRPGQRPEHTAFLRFQQEHWQERNDDNDEREENRRAYLLRRIEQDTAALHFVNRPVFLSFREMAVPVLDHDDGGVHEHSDGKGKSAQRHDVGGDVQVIHRDEGREHGDGQRQDGHESGAEVKQEHDNDQADDDRLLQQVALERVDGGMDEAGAVVSGDDFDAGRKRRLDFRELGFHAVDDSERVHAVAHDDNAAEGGHLNWDDIQPV